MRSYFSPVAFAASMNTVGPKNRRGSTYDAPMQLNPSTVPQHSTSICKLRAARLPDFGIKLGNAYLRTFQPLSIIGHLTFKRLNTSKLARTGESA